AATTPTTHQRTGDPLRNVSTVASTRARYSAMAKVVVANWERGDEVSGGSSPAAIVHPPSSLGLSTPRIVPRLSLVSVASCHRHCPKPWGGHRQIAPTTSFFALI